MGKLGSVGPTRNWGGLAATVLVAIAAAACAREPQPSPPPPPPEAAPAARKRMSEHGLARLRSHEAFEPEIYDDGAGNETIGYGHLVLPGEDYSAGLTEAQAQQLFAEDVQRVVDPSLDKIQIELAQNQIDALGSFIYNVGPKAFDKFLLPAINEGRHQHVTDKMQEYVTGRDQGTGERVTLRGLVRRRRAEVKLFHDPIPLGSPGNPVVTFNPLPALGAGRYEEA